MVLEGALQLILEIGSNTWFFFVESNLVVKNKYFKTRLIPEWYTNPLMGMIGIHVINELITVGGDSTSEIHVREEMIRWEEARLIPEDMI